MRFNLSSGVLALIINLVLIAVGMKHECISWNAIEKKKKRTGTEARYVYPRTSKDMDGALRKHQLGFFAKTWGIQN